MSNRQTQVICTNFFQSASPQERKRQLTRKWAALVNEVEKGRTVRADIGECGLSEGREPVREQYI